MTHMHHHCCEQESNALRASRVLRKVNTGLTLLQLIMVLSILGVISGIVLSRVSYKSSDVKKNTCYVNKGQIEVQVQVWYRNKGSWPANNLSDIGANTTYFPAGSPVCPVDGSAYTLDSSTHRVVGHTH